jgi:predicted nucleotidyltransferase
LEKNIHKLKNLNPYLKKVILFGSYARERPHYGSDVDLLIIVSKHIENDFEIIYEALFDFSLEFEWSPLIVLEDRFNKLKSTHNHFFNEALERGITIWSEI